MMEEERSPAGPDKGTDPATISADSRRDRLSELTKSEQCRSFRWKFKDYVRDFGHRVT